MGNRTSQTSKKEALKRKLQGSSKQTGSDKTSKLKNAVSKQKKAKEANKQRVKALQRAFSVPDNKNTLQLSQASTKHHRGRRELCTSLDRSLIENNDLNEALRGIGQTPILTQAQLAQRAREEQERMAMVYEKHQEDVKDTMDELAQLMSA